MAFWLLGFVVYLLARKAWPRQVSLLEKISMWAGFAVLAFWGVIVLSQWK